MREFFKTTVSGDVQIFEDGKLIREKKNAIHPANMAIAIARGLSNAANHQVFKIKLGNQGTYVDSSQQIIFRPANTIGANADLYNPTYVEVVDDSNSGVGIGNSVTFTTIPASTSTRVIVTCVISSNEAVNRNTDSADGSTGDGLDAVDNTPTEGEFFFDELGLFTSGGTGTPSLLNEDEELMLSHLIFSPIEHTGNREITIIYSLTITVT